MLKSRRVQVLLEEAQYERLHREAERRGGSVASVIRAAVDRLLSEDPAMSLGEAADVLLDAPPVPVDDWAVMKEELYPSSVDTNR